MQREWLQDKRNNIGYTQEQVANLTGIKRAYYTQIELGQRRPSVSVAKRIGEVLGFNWTIFFNEECSEKRHKNKKEVI
ncbi:helix-turn-helix protein [Melghiribacillus thermohalophilus]|uniref:Helix-turn-helix protein n=1 Tax=Melghiribacillus thermohalophilus TaxID=1324956 RepID=A0A4V2V220_9BACI|nr:helix-turn-helix transcriptional regulator [Melghiribacillus thermohalophilus]TCT23352.1 helix-turn-helix protein [Melghiribacillus thermohalophilus]